MGKVLIVEDEEPLREVYRMILSTQAHEVDIAGNGKEALDKCTAETYDLVLLDLMMPVLDGVGFLQKLAATGKMLPKIVILSNLSDGDTLTRALKLGASRALLKADLSPKQLIAMVRQELETA